MGCASSKKAVPFAPEVFPLKLKHQATGGRGSKRGVTQSASPAPAASFRVQVASTSLAYCLVQDSCAHRALILDPRPPAEFKKCSLRNAVNVYGLMQDSSAFKEWLQTAGKLKTVLVCDATGSVSEHLKKLLSAVKASNVSVKEVLVIDGGLKAFASRFDFCLSNSPHTILPAPYEIIAPRPGSSGGFAVFLSGEAVVRAAKEAISRLGVTLVMNLTNRQCPIEQLSGGNSRGVKEEQYSCYGVKELPYRDAAAALQRAARKGQRVLVYDLSGSVHSPAVVCWWYIAHCGGDTEMGLAHLKRKVPNLPQFPMPIFNGLIQLQESVRAGKAPPSVVLPSLESPPSPTSPGKKGGSGVPFDNSVSKKGSTTVPLASLQRGGTLDSTRVSSLLARSDEPLEGGRGPVNVSARPPPSPSPASQQQKDATGRPGKGGKGKDMVQQGGGLFEHIDRAVSEMSKSLSKKDLQEALRTVHLTLNNVIANPSEPKFRKIRCANSRFHSTVGRHPSAMKVLAAAGFLLDTPTVGGEGGEAEVCVYLPASVLSQRLRDVLSRLPPPPQLTELQTKM
uniref:Rhodanese domain-containing protein n=1 Tax=Chromera velia CCMP2878 TaxID=1169474 RepID=A0A0G4GTW7_9ALVE|eukprot:Cvel_740.t1-p1 / transcript=Cvel_740.t1 / gene=Cvel_740 / organism=Chromera_velia_CCMP2878 / gene_product=hypothetical protein / transcript_product=hypothetical protein / location=Cvel_scaffold23:24119-25810(+) / protein_length=564 / sequence_SO=supercontig / SO=protein_coding / is_pseudo=false